jgi:D-alanyl-D-alanine carboxypeptidase (penicillin-binding protein 5/6)
MRLIFYIIIFTFINQYSFAVDTKADQAIVIDFNTNEVLFEKNADKRMPPASMTKIMTVYAAFDRIKNTNLSIKDKCIISPKAYKMGGSRTFLEIDDEVTIDDLLKGIIIQSGNDAALALSECLAGTENDFAILMNVYGKKIGLLNSNFINSSGWPEDNHYSTVRDIAIISNALIKDFPELYSYFKIMKFSYNDISQPNRNKLLSKVSGADGLKTGYTKKSGWGISGSAIKNDRRITVVINGTNSSRSRLNESSYLLNWAFSQTSQKKLLSKGQVVKNVDVWLGNQSSINLISEEDVISTVSFDQMQLINSSISYQKPIEAPIKKGDQLGNLIINISGKRPITIPLVAETDVKNINPINRLFAAIKYLIFGNSLDEKL